MREKVVQLMQTNNGQKNFATQNLQLQWVISRETWAFNAISNR